MPLSSFAPHWAVTMRWPAGEDSVGRKEPFSAEGGEGVWRMDSGPWLPAQGREAPVAGSLRSPTSTPVSALVRRRRRDSEAMWIEVSVI